MQRDLRASRWLAIPTAMFVLGLSGFVASPASADPGNGNAKHEAATAKKAERTTGSKQDADHKAGSKGTSSGSKDKATGKSSGDKGGSTTVKHTRPNTYQAQADPDGAENGGVDQPGGQGGTIGYQDGNNGSGNDVDCEDDNRGKGVPGHCKQRPSENAPGQNKPGHDKPGHDKPGHDKPGHDKPGHDKPGAGEDTSEKPSQDTEDEGTTPGGDSPISPTEGSDTAPVEQVLMPVLEITAPVEDEIAGVSEERSAPAADVAAVNRVAPTQPQSGILPQTGLAGNIALFGLGGLLLALVGGLLLQIRLRDGGRA